ncbi:hypothetical protein [Fructobacillus evanidus]|uniref:Uncharacterized protein n=1 Tax=Fructobacillus evanidus TaxID=3064281 RepID=A0ABN9YLS8_9LACO|nr:unnamed protein product [Fructobacillus sp. LMG 32999]CAK1231637.1 unnamed protein product [Fructobacillus sp. LMG 32999]CAK1232955.1 unnamed protein product [Fructobacillus sp. LMG 32999]CAK1235638.1 unnamed protein product [Fructobacillus sp. LMG 32999]CAK1238858.1 unnamed protein product [Fructobacillus sp. LMG 32999]
MALTLITSVVVFELETLRNYQKKQRELILQNKAANQEKRKALERWQSFVDQTPKPKEEGTHDGDSKQT